MLKEKSPINQASVDSFSRQSTSFYTSLCIKVYEKYEWRGVNECGYIGCCKFEFEVQNFNKNSQRMVD
jgi:hypothetical protein